MKYAGFCLALLCGAVMAGGSTVAAEGIVWKTSYREAYEESVRTHRPMLIKITAEGCPACAQLAAETLSDPTVAAQVASRFVAVELDAAEDIELVRRLRVEAVPTIVYVDASLTIRERVTGFQSPAEMTSNLSETLAPQRQAPVMNNGFSGASGFS